METFKNDLFITLLMDNLENIKIDKEKVRERINRFIRNEGKSNVYVDAPSQELIEKMLYAKSLDETIPYPILFPKTLLSKPSDYPLAKAHLNIRQALCRTDYQIWKIGIEGMMMGLMAKDWELGRYYENHPEKKLNFSERLSNIFSGVKTLQQLCDKRFFAQINKAYAWLQEGNPLEQCDLKNLYALNGLDSLNKMPERISPKPPLDEFVSEQISKIPPEIIDNSLKQEIGFKLVCKDRVVDMDGTLKTLYY